MVRVHDLVDEYEQKLVARWASAALRDGSGALDEGLRDRVGRFLRDLGGALSTAAATGAPALAHARTEPADRSDVDLDLLAATRAFGALHLAILELAAAREVVVTPAEQLTIASHVSAAVSKATEVRLRHQGEAAWRAAHQLRNPLGSAMMAVSLLRARIDFGPQIRLVDTLERNLKRLQGVIDESTGGVHGRDAAASAPGEQDEAASAT